jgi:hypothetical protein
MKEIDLDVSLGVAFEKGKKVHMYVFSVVMRNAVAVRT